MYSKKRWEVNNTNVAKMSLKCEGYIEARMPTAGSTQNTGTTLAQIFHGFPFIRIEYS